MTSRRATRALTAAVLAVALVGCGSNAAQTNQSYQPAVGVIERGDGVDALNVHVVANPDGSGTMTGTLVVSSGEDDQLTEVTAALAGEPLDVTFTGPLVLTPAQPANLGTTGAVVVDGTGLEPGRVVQVDLRFENAAPLTFMTTVVERTETMPYDEVPTPTPTTDQPVSTG